jgi:kumamolisin
MLDIEVAGALAPGTAISVYFAANTDAGFVDAVTQAAHAEPTPTAISISWGGPESSWTQQSMSALDDACADAVALGVTVLAAAGDSGSTDGETDGSQHCDFPASSPHVLACGGTSLTLDSSGLPATETVWNDGASTGGATGGGVSAVYPLPSWQANAGVPGSGRGVPDVAGNADPDTGYQVYTDGQSGVVGGTSAVAPLWSALICLLAQAAAQSTGSGSGSDPGSGSDSASDSGPGSASSAAASATAPGFGLIQNALYKGVQPGVAQAGFHDVTSGNNGAFSAGPGWDACTGLGSPIGTALGPLLEAAGSGGTAAAG